MFKTCLQRNMVNKYELYKVNVVSLQFNLRFSEVIY